MNKDLRFKIQDLRTCIKKNWKFMNSRQEGFTLIELLIVVVIIGVLSSLLMTNFITVRQRSRDAQRKADLRQMQSALELYRADQGSYKTQNTTPYQLNSSASNCPTSSSLTNAGGTITYMQKVPCEPLGTSAFNAGDYYYYSDGTTYTLAACLENTGDTQGITRGAGSSFTTPLDAAVPACSSGVYYVVTNP